MHMPTRHLRPETIHPTNQHIRSHTVNDYTASPLAAGTSISILGLVIGEGWLLAIAALTALTLAFAIRYGWRRGHNINH